MRILFSTRLAARLLLVVLLMLTGLLSISAQEDQLEVTPEATPSLTETFSAPPTEIPPVPPTDLPATETPIDPPPIEATSEATPETTPEITVDATSSVPTPVPTLPGLPPEPALVPLYADSFADGTASAWILGADWTVITSDADFALQGGNSPLELALYDNLLDVAVQSQVWIAGGTARLQARTSMVGGYMVELLPEGVVNLYRADILMQTAAVPPSDVSPWRALRLSAIGTTVRVTVDGLELIALTDDMPLPPGKITISGSEGALFRVDNVQLWIPADQPIPPTVVLTPTETPTETVTPMPEVTAEATPAIVASIVPMAGAPMAEGPIIVTAMDDQKGGTCDTTHCNLREAITLANSTSEFDVINFNIPGIGNPFTIYPLSCKLPDIIYPVEINGYSQPDARPATDTLAAVIKIEIAGNSAQGGAGCPANPDGLKILAGGSGSTVKGLAVTRWLGHGINIEGASNVTIEGNFIGLEVEGSGDYSNLDGIHVKNAPNNLIGGTTASARNVISGNRSDGIEIEATTAGASNGNIIRGNYIGTDKGGSVAQPNVANGIMLNGVPALIGGDIPGSRNVISGNGSDGIEINGLNASWTVVQGNFIGISATGTLRVPNVADGVFITGSGANLIGGAGISPEGACTGPCNVITGNGSDGIEIAPKGTSGVTDSFVQGNFIGLAPNGNSLVTTGGITGNAASGVHVRGVASNHIGMDATRDPATRNIISGNQGGSSSTAYGIFIEGTSATINDVFGNYIGTNSTGTAAVPNRTGGIYVTAPSTYIGGGGIDGLIYEEYRNIISGNLGFGIEFSGADGKDNRLRGNYIGTTANGMSALANGGDGVRINNAKNNHIGEDTNILTRNIISGNGGDGVEITGAEAEGTHVQTNYIGSNKDGNAPIPNQQNGVRITNSAKRNQIGLNHDADPNIQQWNNVIAYNGLTGIAIEPTAGTGNSTMNNVIKENGGLGIDLGTTGPTLNDLTDADTGPNNLQNFPVLTSVTRSSGQVNIQAILRSTPERQFRVDFFAIAGTCDPSGYGEGPNYIGSAGDDPLVPLMTDASGIAYISKSIPDSKFDQFGANYFTMTATDFDDAPGKFPEYNTSEFSICNNRNNNPPTISDLPDQTRRGRIPVQNLPFTIGDAETLPQNLQLAFFSSNETIVPVTNIVPGGSGANRTVSVTVAENWTIPVPPATAQVVITVRVTDASGAFNEDSFVLTIEGNKAPVITPTTIAAATTYTNIPKVITGITVKDEFTALNELQISATSDNQAVLPNNQIQIECTPGALPTDAATCSLTLTPALNVPPVPPAPAPNPVPFANVTFSVSDGSDTVTRLFKLTVNQNKAPTISNIPDQTAAQDPANKNKPGTVVEAGMTRGPLAFTIADTTSTGVLTVSAASSDTLILPNDAIVLGGSGGSRNIMFTPEREGTVTVTVTVSDGKLSASDTFNVTVIPGSNPRPTITPIEPDPQITYTNLSIDNIAFTIGDDSTPVDQLIVEATSDNQAVIPDSGLVLDGTYEFRSISIAPVLGLPTSGTEVSANVTIRVIDLGGAVGTETFKVTIKKNTPPSIYNIPNQTTSVDTTINNIPFGVDDVEFPESTLQISGTSNNQVLVPDANIHFGGSNSDRTVSITPVTDQLGQATITITVTDVSGATATDTFVVTVNPNTGPSISDIPNRFTSVGIATRPILFTVNDTETPNSLTVVGESDEQWLVANANIQISGTGTNRTLVITPEPGQMGSANITITVTDPKGLAASDTFTLTVSENTPPIISTIGNQTMSPNTVGGPFFFTVDDGSETPADQLLLEATSSNETLLPSTNIVIGGTGSERVVTVYPVNGQAGQTTIEITVTDEAGGTDTAIFTLDVRYPPPMPNMPAHLSTLPKLKPTFSWTAVPGAKSYQVEIDITSDFNSANIVDPIVTTTSYIPTQPLKQHVYFWRVKALDAFGTDLTPWSVVPSFTVNLLKSPTNRFATIDTTPLLSWNTAYTGAVYTLEIGTKPPTDPTFTPIPLPPTCLPTASSCTLVTPLAKGVYYWRVKVDLDPTPIYWQFTVTGTPPVAPVLSEPVASAFLKTNTPSLTWKQSTSTVDTPYTYEVQVDNATSFASPEFTGITLVVFTPTISIGVNPSLDDGKYYWRVRTINSLGVPGAWSASRTFTVDTILPAAPVVKTPVDLFTTNDTTPTFTWGTVTSANRYVIEVATDDTFGTPAFPAVTVTTGTYTVPAANGLPNGTYYWRVKALDAANNESLYSITRTIIINILKLPANGSHTINQKPTFSWSAVKTGARYTLQITLETDTTFINPLTTLPAVCQNTTLTSCIYSPTLPHGRYIWRVNVDGVPAEKYWLLIVTLPLPLAPAPAFPINAGYVNDNTPALTWKASTSTIATPYRYEIQVDNSSTFASPEYVQTTGTNATFTSVTVPLPDGKYYWRIRTLNFYGAPSAWTTVRNFTIDTVAPPVPVLRTPETNTITADNTPTLVWNAAAGANRYRIDIATESDFDNFVIKGATVTTTSYTVPNALALPNGTYYWRVRAMDAAGNVSAPSLWRSFRVAAP